MSQNYMVLLMHILAHLESLLVTSSKAFLQNHKYDLCTWPDVN